MLIPGCLLLFIFSYLPMYGVVIAFQNFSIYDGFFGSEWVGLHHIKLFVSDPYFFRLIRNTFLINFYSLIFTWWQPILFALLLNELLQLRFKKIVQTISYLPHFISTVIVVGILFRLLSYNGVINYIFSFIIPDWTPTVFLNKPELFRFIYITSGVWQGVGWGSIIYLAALAGINPELYEAAFIEGANRLQRARHITIPGIMPTITILLILSMGGMLSVGFEKVFLLQNPLTMSTSDVISTFVYRRGIQGAQFSYAAAVGLFNNIIGFVLVASANQIARRVGEISLW